jgi:hypothetical protein
MSPSFLQESNCLSPSGAAKGILSCETSTMYSALQNYKVNLVYQHQRKMQHDGQR